MNPKHNTPSPDLVEAAPCRRDVPRGRRLALGTIIGLAAFAAASASPTSAATTWTSTPGPREICAGATVRYAGPAPLHGGDPVRAETEASYFARTGDHLPEWTGSPVIDGVWCGHDPTLGGEPLLGEYDESYAARTGHHLGR